MRQRHRHIGAVEGQCRIVAADLGVDVNVTTSDAGSAKGTANMNDLVLTSAELAPELEGTTTPVEVITNFMDTDEIKSVLEKYAD